MLVGAQLPRIRTVPKFGTSAGDEAIELAASAGLILDPWQQHVMRDALGEESDGRWSAFEVGVVVPRQNGKGAIIEARELAGLFLFGEKLILHSAHEFKTASEAFLRIKSLVDNTDMLRKRVSKMRTSHGEEGIELKGGARLRFVARSTGSGRGFSGDCVILDESYELSADAMAALLPTLSARRNPQLWYLSSAGMVGSHQLRRVRARGRSDDPGRLAYFEWSAVETASLDDRQAWAQANPGLGIRIREEIVEGERRALPDQDFARERLGIWAEDGAKSVIDMDIWAKLGDPNAAPGPRHVFALDASPDRRSAAIGSASRMEDGKLRVKVLDWQPVGAAGLSWMVDRVVELKNNYSPPAVVLDPASPAGSLILPLAEKGIEVVQVTGRETAQACGAFFDDAMNGDLCHVEQEPLTTALKFATTRNMGDAWVWDRRDPSADICGLYAVTLAAHGYRKHGGDEVFEPWVAFV